MAKFSRLDVGDPAPWFKQATDVNPNFAFDSVAGRYIVMCFYGIASDKAGQDAQDVMLKNRKLFDDDKMSVFGVSVDPNDKEKGLAKDSYPGIRHFWDFDLRVSRMYGVLPLETPDDGKVFLRRQWMILDPALRVRGIIPFNENDSNGAALIKFLKALPPVKNHVGFEVPVPVIVLPGVFEPEFCQHLIGLYEAHGGEDSGFMREQDGRTVAVKDYGHKRRSDFTVEDESLISTIQSKIHRRIVPEIKKIHQFEVTRMERYLVGCYDSETGGHFMPHRDNTTKGTAHRRFAVSINLNSEFEGGEVSFPEFGPRSFKPPVGGAVVFSCSMLHAVSKVTKGKRFAFLPFLYDDAAARIREANNSFVENGVYTANQSQKAS